MLENLKASVSSIFDLYKLRSKSFFNFSLAFLLISSLATAIISIVILYISDRLLETENLIPGDFNIENFFSNFFMVHVTELSKYLMILAVSLYAIYLQDNWQDDDKKLSLKDFWQRLSRSNWQDFFVVLFIVCLVYVFTLKEVFYFGHDNDSGLLRMLRNFSGEGRVGSFQLWLLSIIQLLREFLPYIGAFYIILSDFYDHPFRQLGSKFKTVFLPVLFLSFCVLTISGQVVYYINSYVIRLIEIPFNEMISLAILSFVIYMIISAYFLVALAGVFLFPVLHDYNRPMDEIEQINEIPAEPDNWDEEY